MARSKNPAKKPETLVPWTVAVKNFGKIEQASVTPAPLTLLIGDNNSGKSYLMTLLYGLWTVNFWNDRYIFYENSSVYQDCISLSRQIWESCKKESEAECIIQGKRLQAFQELLNELLAQNKEKLLKKLFNRKTSIEELRITFPADAVFDFHFSIRENAHGKKVYQVTGHHTRWATLVENDAKSLGPLWQLTRMLQGMLQWNTMQPVYFPTARTGFLLTYKDLTRNALQERFSLEETAKNLLTKPNTDFLTALSSIQAETQLDRCPEIAAFMEKHLICGQIHVSDELVPAIEYLPDGSSSHLPMYVSSGVVTETVPLLLFLRHYPFLDALLIEEPEISLHPQLQWEMARVLIRLTNRGIPVVVSTHSDIILQHINNMIKADGIQKKNCFLEQTGYEAADLLSKNKAAVYQFDGQSGGRTQLNRLPCGDDGFEALTFYQTLKSINKQIDWIENERTDQNEES